MFTVSNSSLEGNFASLEAFNRLLEDAQLQLLPSVSAFISHSLCLSHLLTLDARGQGILLEAPLEVMESARLSIVNASVTCVEIGKWGQIGAFRCKYQANPFATDMAVWQLY